MAKDKLPKGLEESQLNETQNPETSQCDWPLYDTLALSPEELAMIEEYRKLWEWLRPVEWWEFICIEDKEYSWINYNKTYVSKRTNRDEFERRKRSVWCIGYNNGVMTYVDWEWRQYVTVWTKEAEKALEQAWYKYEWMNIYVPFSNWERFTDEDTQAEWEYLRKKSKVERRRAEESAMIEEYRKLWEWLRPVEWWEFICIEDKEYWFISSDKTYVSKRTNRDEFERRKESVWCYWYNNSVLTYVDWEWRQYVTVWTKEAEEALEQAWYKGKWMGIYVPFSNWECFTDEDAQAEWEYLRDKSKVERKRTEKK